MENDSAHLATYGDAGELAYGEEIENFALDYLAGRLEMAGQHFGPIAYNMIANDGQEFGGDLLETVRGLEVHAKEYLDKITRNKELNERKYADINALPLATKEEIAAACSAAGCNRVVVASLMQDDSDMQTDYYGGSTLRTVVIGFFKGKRESFAKLRKAAAAFPPTADFGPGKGIFIPRVVVTSDHGSLYRGKLSPWHNTDVEFTTRQEAEDFIAQQGPLDDARDGEIVHDEFAFI
jgi:hypothetical protein